MKNSLSKILYLLILLAAFSSCSQKKPATVVIKSKSKYSRQDSQTKYNQKPSKKDNNGDNISSGAVIVGSGDTLYSISQKNKVQIRELINENNLTPPYNLKKGSKIILPKAKYHDVASGETLYSISRNYNMNVNDLIKINNLQEPYKIKTGDHLQISNHEDLKTTDSDTTNIKTANLSKKDIGNNIAKNENKDLEAKNLPEKSIPKTTPQTLAKSPSEAETASEENNHSNKFIWPVSGKIISKFGRKAGGLYNDGVNIKAKNGDPVRAAEQGTVAYVGNELRGYGNLIIIKHSGKWISAYAHLETFEVKRGDKVKKGSVIAKVGSTGGVSSPQLYFGIRKGHEAVNPELYVKSSGSARTSKNKSKS